MDDKGKLKILFRIPFTIYFLAVAKFETKKLLCICIKQINTGGKYYFEEISLHEDIEKLYL